jgi:hypothetical protein
MKWGIGRAAVLPVAAESPSNTMVMVPKPKPYEVGEVRMDNSLAHVKGFSDGL